MAAGAVDIGLLRHARILVVGLLGAVQLLVPPDRASRALFSLQRGFFRLEFLNEQGRFRGVVGAGENGHGTKLPEMLN